MKESFKGRLVLVLLLLSVSVSLSAQRLQQTLKRGVVAVNNGTSVLVSWRKLAQDGKDITYNLYRLNMGAASYTKVNSTPIAKTNFSTTTASVPFNSELAITTISNGVESEKSDSFVFKSQAYRSVFMNITYSNTLASTDYVTKFVWPADLDGDGEYDYVVDRMSTTDISTRSHKIEGYLRDGTYLWTVDMGPNVDIDQGQNDMVVAYDMNCDGKAEVVIKSSDGTRFWDHTNMTWGKYLLNSTNGDTDNDGIIDYNSQNVKNPPQYITVINGMTGEEMNTIEMNYSEMHDGSDQYSRTNKSEYMGTDYANLNGHMAICYFDGIHPSVVMEYLDRTQSTGTHHNYVTAWGYNFSGAKATDWVEKFTWSRNDKTPWPAEFHMLRVCDVDLDGKDEMLQGGYAISGNGKMLFSAAIGHGDRFRVGDINPDRPGLETYAIQQSSLLGQLLYDASTGKHLKEWYLSSITDVGRGECMDVDPSHKGYEIFSTMPNLYDCKGDVITTGSTPFPTEGIWWDGELDREMLSAPDGSGFNAMVTKYNQTRLIQFSKESGWATHSTYGVRPMFFGDIIGDWRDEVILKKGDETNSTGIIGYSTEYATDYSLYCLQQDPSYRMDCTTRGYYQSPMTDYYLGYDMPQPPLPPSIVTDLRWKSGTDWNATGSNFQTFDNSATSAFADGKSVIFDISGDNSSTINISSTVKPSFVYVMAPIGHNYTWSGNGSLSGTMDLWKSMNGSLTVDKDLDYTGKTSVSEGSLVLNGTMKGALDLRAKGTLAGNAILNDTTIFEGGLNYEGCRLAPGTSENLFGTITSNKSMILPGSVYIEENLQTSGTAKCDLLKVNGDLTFKGTNTFTIVPSETKPAAGEYVLAECTGTLTADSEKIAIRGLVGLNYSIEVRDKQIVLNIKGSRDAASGVLWTGSNNGIWDYQTENFSLEDQPTSFVSGDQVIFGDEPTQRTITLSDLMLTNGVTFENNSGSYTINGNGGLSGAGGLTKTGNGTLNLSATKSDYTGATIIKGGTAVVTELADKGTASCIGTGNVTSNVQLEKCTFTVNNANTSTNRIFNITDTVAFNIPSGYTSLKSAVNGTGTLVKSGSGQLSLTNGGANSYSGGTILKGGTLAQGAYNSTFGTLGSKFTMQGGTVIIFNNNNTSAVPNFSYAVNVADGTNNTINAGKRCYIGGSFSGGGTLNITIPYVRTDFSANWSNFTGKLIVTGSDMRLSAATDLSNATLSLGSNVYLGHFQSGSGTALSLTSKIGALISTDTTATVGNGTYNVGYNNADVTFAGVLACTSVNKYGTGIWTLTGKSSSSPINIYEGTLRVTNSAGYATSGNVVIRDGGIVDGYGILKNVTVMKGGTLGAGISATLCKTITVAGNVSMASGSTLRCKVRSYTNDKFCFNGTTTFSGDTLYIKNIDKTFSEGDELSIFIGTGTLNGTYVIYPSVPAKGLAWDDSTLLTDGKLKVVTATGIDDITSDKEVDVYDVNGVMLRSKVRQSKALEGLNHGIYVINGNKIVK